MCIRDRCITDCYDLLTDYQFIGITDLCDLDGIHCITGNIIQLYCYDGQIIGSIRTPVSYTHLDVYKRQEMDCVCVNDYDGGYLAGQKLTRLSHSRFLYIAGPPTIESQIRRQQGILHALQDAHLPSDALRIISFEEINRTIEQNTILQLLHPINYTAIIAYNDEFAYYVMNTLRQNGYRIPEDISICGFDHICSSMPDVYKRQGYCDPRRFICNC